MLDLRRLLIPAALMLAACLKQEPYPATGTLTTETFHSDIVEDDYVLRVRLPPDYDSSTANYPLIIQLDPTYAGLEEYATTVGLVSHYAGLGDWPEAIVVGVDYPDPYTRERDYTIELPLDPEFGNAGADRFYQVLRDEILPHIEAEHRVDPSQRILVGHSKGGMFAWYASFRHAPPEPPLFSAVVAADCGYDEALFTLERWHAERSDSLPLRIYASQALYNGATQKVVFDAMMARLQDRDYVGLELVQERLDTDHAGAVAPSFEAGLEHALIGGEP
jgi:hypothetical protein